MQVDKRYCMSSYLMYRTIVDHEKCWSEQIRPHLWEDTIPRRPVHDSVELENHIKSSIETISKEKKVALALSGGIDSAILAKFMPPGSTAYTFQCIVPGVEVTDETPMAARYAKECGLKHEVIKIYWEDFENYAPILMKHKGAPFHSIEVQIYKAALKAKSDGVDVLLFGENADIIYGGMNGLLSQDWLIGDFIDRYTYVMPYKVLKQPELILEPFYKYTVDGHVDPHSFVSDIFRIEAMGSYTNAVQTAGISLVCPFAETYLAVPIDYTRIRNGENKYLVREVFQRLYPDLVVPPKTPMPRPMNEWFKDWQGPVRPEFWPHCTDGMTGDQKWLVWCLEKFLDLCEK
ncbi:asparagine synthase C-terminal domain-containing protein [[Clostridium] leptum]|uniref:asparagine synthase (glutamine-hydrolyzing) n=1 Tax=Solibaculum mannosilyticum TaxID=2780922 RepID=A0A7I8D3A1_9FIRM|nr:asparagine synthase C-terminal domain-containing protein [Solibaculum mannosilyticum]MCO7136063.1 asparagine synthase C-terminal domain-containing protein [[Clostridium] leptum]BCI61240.1 hypothetical protein C12CBH8_18790 [Solibaculum mannosilyticum]